MAKTLVGTSYYFDPKNDNDSYSTAVELKAGNVINDVNGTNTFDFTGSTFKKADLQGNWAILKDATGGIVKVALTDKAVLKTGTSTFSTKTFNDFVKALGVTSGNTNTGGSTGGTETALPTLKITAPTASVTEGNTGTANATFKVTLSAASTKDITFKANTADGTATLANKDYAQVKDQTFTIKAGQTSIDVPVKVTGDTAVEKDETFNVSLSSATNATIATASATATIKNDDVAPTVVDLAKVTNAGTAALETFTFAKGAGKDAVKISNGDKLSVGKATVVDKAGLDAAVTAKTAGDYVLYTPTATGATLALATVEVKASGPIKKGSSTVSTTDIATLTAETGVKLVGLSATDFDKGFVLHG